jgi:hypothetical protein
MHASSTGINVKLQMWEMMRKPFVSMSLYLADGTPLDNALSLRDHSVVDNSTILCVLDKDKELLCDRCTDECDCDLDEVIRRHLPVQKQSHAPTFKLGPNDSISGVKAFAGSGAAQIADAVHRPENRRGGCDFLGLRRGFLLPRPSRPSTPQTHA